MKPILVTGPTGFLGKHLVERLAGVPGSPPVRLLCRGECPWTDDPRFEVVHGDVTSPGDMFRAAKDVAQIYHLAGMVSRDPNQAWRMYQIHIGGTRNVLDAALHHRVERVLVVSSSGTVAVSREPVVHDENSGYKHDVVGRWPYYLSKIYEEKTAFTYFSQHGLPVVVVNPALLLGPGDDRNSSTGDVQMFLEGQIMTVPLGGMSFVDVRDCAAGVVNAMACGRPGERYLLGGPNWTFREITGRLAVISGLRAPRVQLSLTASLLGARLMRRLLPLTGKSFKLDDETIRMSALFWYCNSAKAQSELGFKTRDPLVTLRDTVEDIRRRKQQPS